MWTKSLIGYCLLPLGTREYRTAKGVRKLHDSNHRRKLQININTFTYRLQVIRIEFGLELNNVKIPKSFGAAATKASKSISNGNTVSSSPISA